MLTRTGAFSFGVLLFGLIVSLGLSERQKKPPLQERTLDSFI